MIHEFKLPRDFRISCFRAIYFCCYMLKRLYYNLPKVLRTALHPPSSETKIIMSSRSKRWKPCVIFKTIWHTDTSNQRPQISWSSNKTIYNKNAVLWVKRVCVCMREKDYKLKKKFQTKNNVFSTSLVYWGNIPLLKLKYRILEKKHNV